MARCGPANGKSFFATASRLLSSRSNSKDVEGCPVTSGADPGAVWILRARILDTPGATNDQSFFVPLRVKRLFLRRSLTWMMEAHAASLGCGICSCQ